MVYGGSVSRQGEKKGCERNESGKHCVCLRRVVLVIYQYVVSNQIRRCVEGMTVNRVKEGEFRVVCAD